MVFIFRPLPPWKKSYDQPKQHIKKQRHYSVNKGPSSQSYGFSSSYIWMWKLDYKESWQPKNWCFWTVVLEKTVESPLDCKEIQSVHPKGNQPWIFIRRTDADAETPILGPSDAKNWLIWTDPDAGKDWRWEEKGTTEDKMVGWHHQLVGHESEQASGVADGQGGLVCCSPWGHKELDATELNGTYLSSLISLPDGHMMFHSWWMTWIYYYISLLYALIATSLFALDIPLASPAYAWKSTFNSISSLVEPGVRWGERGTQDTKFRGTQNQVSDSLYFVSQGPHAPYPTPDPSLWCLPCYTLHLPKNRSFM